MNLSRVVRKRFTISDTSGNSIHGDFRYIAETRNAPVVVICHGFMAFKEWGFFPHVAMKLAEAGWNSVTFNFSHNGVRGHENRITEFGKFERNTIRQELSDLGSLLDAIERGEIGEGRIDTGRIALLGHSRGGGVAIVRTSRDDRIRALVTWSAIASFDRWTDHQKVFWRSRGFLPLAKDSTVSPLRLGKNLLEENEQYMQDLNIVHAARNVRIPWLIVHGKVDYTVRHHEAKTLAQAATHANVELMLVDFAGHLFNAASRAEDDYRTLDTMIERTSDWMHRQLS